MSETGLKTVHVFPSEESYLQNAGSVTENDIALVPLNIDIKSDVLDLFYPVGTVYQTANASFNPNTAWGGTWVKIKNRFLLASGSRAVGAVGGEESVTLTVNQIPNHSHGTGQIRSNGTFKCDNNGKSESDAASGDFSHTSHWSTYQRGGGGSDSWGAVVDFQFYTTSSGNTSDAGGGQSHNNMPPFEVVNIWKRTA